MCLGSCNGITLQQGRPGSGVWGDHLDGREGWLHWGAYAEWLLLSRFKEEGGDVTAFAQIL